MTENTLANVAVKYKGKSGQEQNTTFEEFLKLPNELLSENEIKLKEAMSKLYQLNDRQPPLFKSFPERTDKKKLTINATTLENCETAGVSAAYSPAQHNVDFLNSNDNNLLSSLAHELKHAEQFSSEMIEQDQKLQKENGLAFHQLRTLAESQAFLFGEFVGQLSNGNEQLNWESIQKEYFPEALKKLHEEHLIYWPKWDIISPIDVKKDTSITDKQIPESFNLSEDVKKETLKRLQEMPKEHAPATRLIDLLDKFTSTENKADEQEIKQLVNDDKALNPAFEILQLLYLETKSNDDPNTPLKFDKETQEKRLQTLIKFSNSIENENKYFFHEDVIDFVATHGDNTLLKKLIDAGLDINEHNKDMFGVTPLMTAVEYGEISTVEMLINAGANLDEQDDDSQTALMLAVKKGKVEAVEKLINAEADITIKDCRGRTAFDMAQKNPQILSLLEQAKERQEKERDKEENHTKLGLKEKIKAAEMNGISSTAEPVQNNILTPPQKKDTTNTVDTNILIQQKIESLKE